MATINAVDARAYVNGFDVSGDLNSIEPSPTTQVQDVTTFGSGVTGRRYVATLHDDAFAHAGFYSDDLVAGIGAILDPLKGQVALVALWPAGDAVGRRGYGGNAALLDTGGPSNKTGSVVTVQHGWKVSGGADLLVSTEPKVVVTGSGVQQVTAQLDNGASTPNGGYAYFQVFAIDAAAGLGNFLLQHSPDGTVWSSLAFCTLVGVGAQRVAFAGTVHRYVRRNIILASGKHITIQTAVCRL